MKTLQELKKQCKEFSHFEKIEFGDISYWQAFMTDDAFAKYSKDYPCVKECCGYGSGDTKREALEDLIEMVK